MVTYGAWKLTKIFKHEFVHFNYLHITLNKIVFVLLCILKNVNFLPMFFSLCFEGVRFSNI